MPEVPMPPNRIEIPEIEQEQNSESNRVHDPSDFKWLKIIGVIVGLILTVIGVKIAIVDGSTFISGVTSYFTHLFDKATINPYDKRGFKNFIQLALTLGFIVLGLYYLRKK